jgi:hypothetical protein
MTQPCGFGARHFATGRDTSPWLLDQNLTTTLVVAPRQARTGLLDGSAYAQLDHSPNPGVLPPHAISLSGAFAQDQSLAKPPETAPRRVQVVH